MHRSSPVLVGVCLIAMTGAVSGAEPLTIRGHTGDGTIDANGLPQDESLPILRVGTGGDTVRGLAPVFFFALPPAPSREAITGAELEFQYLGTARGTADHFIPPQFKADLYGLGTRATPSVLRSDYHDGKATATSGTLLASSLIKPTTPAGRLRLSDAAMRDYVASLYQPNGTPTAPYVAFRVNADTHLAPRQRQYQGYELASADNKEKGGEYVPTLRLTVEQREAASTSPAAASSPGSGPAPAATGQGNLFWIMAAVVAGCIVVILLLALALLRSRSRPESVSRSSGETTGGAEAGK
jgi:hypothetical protein